MFTYTVHVITLKTESVQSMRLFHNADAYIIQKLMLTFCIRFHFYRTFMFFHCKTLATLSITLKGQNVRGRKVFKCCVIIEYSEDVGW